MTTNLMIKRLFKVITLFLMLISDIANCQSFGVQSFDGSKQIINVLFNEKTDNLKITALKDTITIKDCIGIIGEMEVLNKSFLKIAYNTRGGSGIHLQCTVLLCVSHRHLVQSLHVTSLFNEEFIDFSKPVDTANLVDVKSVYELKLKLKDDAKQHYILDVKIHDTRKSKSEPKTNYAHDSEVDLSYDSSRNVFYSTYENVSQYFTIYDPKIGRDNKLYIMGTFPAVNLGEYEYYLIKNVWYEKNKYDDLTRYSY